MEGQIAGVVEFPEGREHEPRVGQDLGRDEVEQAGDLPDQEE